MKDAQPREFWKIISRATLESYKEIPIPIVDMTKYFQELNSCPQIQSNAYFNLPPDVQDEFLDDDILEEEVYFAIKGLKRNKAPGIDGLIPEFFKLFNSVHISSLTKIFNRIYESGTFPRTWSIGSIKPIYKRGDVKSPSNYRGITLLPIMSKIMTSILNDRLLEWAESNMKINDSQFGFRKNRRTTDTLYIILTTSLIANKNKTPIYLAFVDLAKAFDSINHNLLWLKLSAMGISTKMLKLQHMYRTARSVVSYDGFTSSEFPCHKGVRQGCPLSPLLFSLFISDLEHELLANSSGKVRIGEQEVRVIMFADDLVLLAETSAGLQQSLSTLYHYCH